MSTIQKTHTRPQPASTWWNTSLARRGMIVLVMTGLFTGMLLTAPVVGDEPSAVAHATAYPHPNAPDCNEYGPGGCVPDKWAFYQGQCTSWVAFRLNDRNQIPFNNTYRQPSGHRWSNASKWVAAANRARIAVNNTPGLGSVAWYPNHVAYVEKLNNDGSIVISEMNYDLHNGFRQRTVRPGQRGWPNKFIHVKDLKSSPSAPALRPVKVTIDEPRRYGPSKYIDRRSGAWYDGWGRDSWTTYTIQNTRSKDTNYFRWEFRVGSGKGGQTRLQVYIPHKWGYAHAKYKVYLNGKYQRTVTVTQENYAAKWVTLRTLRLNPGDKVMVHLSDRSTSPYGTQLVADAMRLVPAS